MTGRAHAALQLDIPRCCRLRGSFTDCGDIRVLIGDPGDEVNVVFDRSTLTRFVELVSELLAVPPAANSTAPAV